MGIGLCTGRKCSYKSHRTQDIRHFLISSKTNPYSRADYPPASPSATYFKREHLPISLLCSSLIAPGFSNLPHNLTTLSYERLHSSEKRILSSPFSSSVVAILRLMFSCFLSTFSRLVLYFFSVKLRLSCKSLMSFFALSWNLPRFWFSFLNSAW